MLLSFHTESRHIRQSFLVLTLLLGAVLRLHSDPLPTPRILSAGGSCPETIVTWTDSGQVAFYLVILMGPATVTQIALGTRVSFFDLLPGNYNVMVRANSTDGNDSDFSAPFPFIVPPCRTCVLPTVQVRNAEPRILWPPNGRSVPVSFGGTVTGITPTCPITQATYLVTDSQGDSRSGSFDVQTDGRFTLNLSLAARRLGQEPGGRVYTFTVTVANEVGSATSNPVRVEVPHDQGVR